jgi:hypothetical protein
MGNLLQYVDRFYPEPDLMREIALRSEYYQPRSLYGFRSTKGFIAPGTMEKLQALSGCTDIALQDVDTRSSHFYHSLKRGRQSVRFLAHIDAAHDPEHPAFALVIYLTPNAPPEAGTGVYRHRETGVWQEATRADARRLGITLKALRQRLQDDGGESAKWELLDRVENCYNRAVLLPAHWYHSSMQEFGSRIDNGKLYHAFFFRTRLNKALAPTPFQSLPAEPCVLAPPPVVPQPEPEPSAR